MVRRLGHVCTWGSFSPACAGPTMPTVPFLWLRLCPAHECSAHPIPHKWQLILLPSCGTGHASEGNEGHRCEAHGWAEADPGRPCLLPGCTEAPMVLSPHPQQDCPLGFRLLRSVAPMLPVPAPSPTRLFQRVFSKCLHDQPALKRDRAGP